MFRKIFSTVISIDYGAKFTFLVVLVTEICVLILKFYMKLME